ncbi:MAG: PspA/IM30 family protein [Gammaproteobacteria bacterium]|nr:PspA/IM30 family protein [Gammaproteobacteria bacterium]
MALINRVSRLFKADFHAVLDQIEEPEQVLKQAIRDMEDELQASELRIATCAQECEGLARHQAELENSVREFSGQLDLCFQTGKDELARGLIRKKLEAERVLKRINARLDANAAMLADQRRLLEENRNTLDSLRQKNEVFSRRTSPRESGAEFADVSWLAGDMNVSDDDVEIAFLHEQSQRSAS